MPTKREPITPANAEAWEAHTLENLRAACPEKERILIGYDAIAAWLTELGFEVSPRTLESWQHLKGMPVKKGGFGTHRMAPMTSTHVVLAWLICSKQARRLRGSGSTSRRTQRKKGKNPVTASPSTLKVPWSTVDVGAAAEAA